MYSPNRNEEVDMGMFFIKDEKNHLPYIFFSKFFDFSININESWYNHGIAWPRQAVAKQNKANKQTKQRRTHSTGWKIEFGQYKSKRTSEGTRPGIIFLSSFG